MGDLCGGVQKGWLDILCYMKSHGGEVYDAGPKVLMVKDYCTRLLLCSSHSKISLKDIASLSEVDLRPGECM